ncbi:hypothetical protein M9H77_03019 [Catharanthus roseus]|uniref:Uncharacterized protein n=1 Tax=Catharanthus roseus TaxID=4058 RepID=A0ACC0CAJ6_CATRO|nr:hypothetical protein M9H77_03019 [Catharanthus roseus]
MLRDSNDAWVHDPDVLKPMDGSFLANLNSNLDISDSKEGDSDSMGRLEDKVAARALVAKCVDIRESDLGMTWRTSSNTCWSLVVGYKFLSQMLSWEVGDSNLVRFWLDD